MAAKRSKAVRRAQTPARGSKPAKAARRASPDVARPARGAAGAKRGRSAAGETRAKKHARQPRAGERPAATPAKRSRTARPLETGVLFEKVAFTMLSVTDPTRARGFYEQILGLKRGLASPDGTWTEYDLPGGGCLALFRHPNPEAARAPGGGASVALEVTDLDALNERLKPLGVVYEGDLVHGPRCRMSNILDSEGNSLILHQLERG